jgi:two-component system, cell cycle response regulator
VSDEHSDNPEEDEFPSERPTLIEEVDVLGLSRSGKVVPRTRPLLTVLTGPEKGAVFSFATAEATIGRSEDAEISIPDMGLSRIHARISRKPGGYYLEDAGSTNGTFVNDGRIEGAVRLSPGERFRLGQRTVLSMTLHDELEVDAALSMRQAAMRDRLTGAYNRGVFDDRLAAEIAFSQRHGAPLSLLIFDVDHFKLFNDEHGHQAGDAVLIAVTEQVQKTVRIEDILARYGGEEFAVIARDTSPDHALVLGERVRRAIERTQVEHEGAKLAVTASIGVATLSKAQPYDFEALVAAADRSLYEAKDAGRNCVRHADPSLLLSGARTLSDS